MGFLADRRTDAGSIDLSIGQLHEHARLGCLHILCFFTVDFQSAVLVILLVESESESGHEQFYRACVILLHSHVLEAVLYAGDEVFASDVR